MSTQDTTQTPETTSDASKKKNRIMWAWLAFSAFVVTMNFTLFNVIAELKREKAMNAAIIEAQSTQIAELYASNEELAGILELAGATLDVIETRHPGEIDAILAQITGACGEIGDPFGAQADPQPGDSCGCGLPLGHEYQTDALQPPPGFKEISPGVYGAMHVLELDAEGNVVGERDITEQFVRELELVDDNDPNNPFTNGEIGITPPPKQYEY